MPIYPEPGTEPHIAEAKRFLAKLEVERVTRGLPALMRTTLLAGGVTLWAKVSQWGALARLTGGVGLRAVNEVVQTIDGADATPFALASMAAVTRLDTVAGATAPQGEYDRGRKTFVHYAVASGTMTVERAGVTATVSDLRTSLPSSPAAVDDWQANVVLEVERNDDYCARPYFVISANGKRVLAYSALVDELFTITSWDDQTQTWSTLRLGAPASYLDALAAANTGLSSYTADAAPDWFNGQAAYAVSPVDIPGVWNDILTPFTWQHTVTGGPDATGTMDVFGLPFLHFANGSQVFFLYQVASITDDSDVVEQDIFGAVQSKTTERIRATGTSTLVLAAYDIDTSAWETVWDGSRGIVALCSWYTDGLTAGDQTRDQPFLGDTTRESLELDAEPAPWLHLLLRDDGTVDVWSSPLRTASTGTVTLAPPVAPTYNFSYDRVTTSAASQIDVLDDTGWTVFGDVGTTPAAVYTRGMWQSGTEGRALFRSATTGCWWVHDEGTTNLAADAREYFLSKTGRWLYASDASTAQVYLNGVSVWTHAALASPYTTARFLGASKDRDAVFVKLYDGADYTYHVVQFVEGASGYELRIRYTLPELSFLLDEGSPAVPADEATVDTVIASLLSAYAWYTGFGVTITVTELVFGWAPSPAELEDCYDYILANDYGGDDGAMLADYGVATHAELLALIEADITIPPSESASVEEYRAAIANDYGTPAVPPSYSALSTLQPDEIVSTPR